VPIPIEMAVRASGLALAFPQIKQSVHILNYVVSDSALLSLLGADVRLENWKLIEEIDDRSMR